MSKKRYSTLRRACKKVIDDPTSTPKQRLQSAIILARLEGVLSGAGRPKVDGPRPVVKLPTAVKPEEIPPWDMEA